jgi:hypothetical protein
MTLASWVREFLRNYGTQIYSTKPPLSLHEPLDGKYGHPPRAHYGVEDMMLRLHAKPPEVRTVHELKLWFTDLIKSAMRNTDVLPLRKYVACFDRWTPPVKGIVCHGDRDDGIVPLEVGVIHLDDADPGSPIPNGEDWKRLMASRDVMRRQLFPILYNACIDERYFTPQPGELLILHGLPGNLEYRNVPLWAQGPGGESTMPVLIPRSPSAMPADWDQREPDAFQRIWLIEGRPGPGGSVEVHREEWLEAKNNIGEADLATCFYDHWFAQENCVVRTGDGDAISIALLYAHERLLPDGNFRNNMYIWMPRVEVGSDKVRRYSHEWFSINELWRNIRSDVRFAGEGVQNAIVTFVTLVILSGTDFFAGPNKNFLPNVGAEKAVWPSFAENTRQFSHMCQLSWLTEPDTRQHRHIVVDVDAFIAFAHSCYLYKYRDILDKKLAATSGATLGATSSNLKDASGATSANIKETSGPPQGGGGSEGSGGGGGLPEGLTMIQELLQERERKRIKDIQRELAKATKDGNQDLVIKCTAKLTKGPSEANTVVEEGRLAVLAGHLDWNLNYWINGSRPPYTHPDPFTQHQASGLPRYGFEVHLQEGPKVALEVARLLPSEFDDNYSRHFMAVRKRARVGQ